MTAAERSPGPVPGTVPDADASARDAARIASVRRLAATAVGARSLQRLTDLATRLLACDSAQVSLLGEMQTSVAGSGLPAGGLGARAPLADSFCAIAAHGDATLVIPAADNDNRDRDGAPVGAPHVGS